MTDGSLLDLLLPQRCPVCSCPGAGHRRCRDQLPPPPSLPPPPGVDACISAWGYDGAGRAVVAALKFRRDRAALAWAAGAVAAAVCAAGEAATAPAPVITWVPTTGRRRRRREGDHGERLARAVAGELGLPVVRLLRRRPGPAQAGRGAEARRAGPPLAPVRRSPATVLVVDDVVTTGGTAAAAARALRGVGAARVVVASAARTRPGRRAS